MPSRRNGPYSRRWYHRICLASSADSSDSSESENYAHDLPLPVHIDEHRPFPLPAATDDWQLLLPPPPPFILDEPPQPVRRIHSYVTETTRVEDDHREVETDDWQLLPPPPPPFILDEPLQPVRRIHSYATEMTRVEDDHREVVRNMEITEPITREKTVCPICKEEFKLGEVAGKLTCDHFFCLECVNGWINFNQNNTCPVCRRRLPSRDFRSSPSGAWEYFLPPVPFHTESPVLVGVETESPPSPSMNNSEAGYDTASDELDEPHAHP